MNKSALAFLVVGAAGLAALFWLFKPPPAPPPPPLAAAAPGPASQPASPAPAVPQPRTFQLLVKGRKLVSGPQVLQVNQGDTVIIAIQSDQVEELHLHGYDRKLELEPGKVESLELVADRSGRFEYELEKSGIGLGALEVQPQ